MSSNSKKNNNKPKSISKKEEYFYTKFSEVLQTFRNDKNLLQTDFFETTGLSNNSISKIERASSKINAVPSLPLAFTITSAYNKPNAPIPTIAVVLIIF